jgi:hypothetical protein
MDEITQMPFHPSIASEPAASRRLRRCAPVLLFLGLIAVALAPGLIAGDRPFQTSLCDDLEPPAACAPLARTISAAMHMDETTPAEPGLAH